MAQPTGVTGVPRTFGTLSIIFASIVLAGSLFGMVGLIVPALVAHAPPSGRPGDAEALHAISTMYLGMGLISTIFAAMSAWLLALGIGQLRYRTWAAVWTPRWGIVALGSIVVMAILMTTTFSSLLGGISSMQGGEHPEAGKQVGTMLGLVYASMMVLFYSPYPILLMVYFSRERVRSAMTT
jgi:hypothetical protein